VIKGAYGNIRPTTKPAGPPIEQLIRGLSQLCNAQFSDEIVNYKMCLRLSLLTQHKLRFVKLQQLASIVRYV